MLIRISSDIPLSGCYKCVRSSSDRDRTATLRLRWALAAAAVEQVYVVSAPRRLDFDQPIELAVLESQGSVATRRRQLTGEFQLEYARADRNRALFRGIELVEAVLVGVFDINESQHDVLTGSVGVHFRLGKVEVVDRS